MSAWRWLRRLCDARPRVSRAWVVMHARRETTHGWESAPRWRSPKEIAQLRRQRLPVFKKRA